MQAENEHTLIVGGGFSGLMAAYFLASKCPGRKIRVIERSPNLGGTFGSIVYPGGEIFDVGIHILYSTGDDSLDKAFFDILPKDQWHVLEGNRKDVAGVFYKGSVQNYSHYVDLRELDIGEYEDAVSSLFSNFQCDQAYDRSTSKGFLYSQFGPGIAEKIHRPILEGLWGVPFEDLDVFAVNTNALERVILFDAPVISDLMNSSMIASRVAFPDQLNLPVTREFDQFALYPRKFGMTNFIQSLEARLQEMGVEIETNTTVEALVKEGEQVRTVTYLQPDKQTITLPVDHVVWSTGLIPLAMANGLDISNYGFDQGPPVIFANLIFDKPLDMQDIYYFYCYDEGFGTYRVSNYINFCPDALKQGYSVCVEFWPARIGMDEKAVCDDEVVEAVLSELRTFGVINDSYNLVFSDIVNKGFRFPIPTVNNMRGFSAIREDLGIGESNVSPVGVMAERGLFFSHDVLRHTKKTVDGMV